MLVNGQFVVRAASIGARPKEQLAQCRIGSGRTPEQHVVIRRFSIAVCIRPGSRWSERDGGASAKRHERRAVLLWAVIPRNH
jgi:hypothetical protein